jgi:hypothetical protein
MSHEVDVSQGLDANLNHPKIQLISHRVEHIDGHGTFEQYSAERHDQAHMSNISKMYFRHWKPSGVSERMWSVN